MQSSYFHIYSEKAVVTVPICFALISLKKEQILWSKIRKRHKLMGSHCEFHILPTTSARHLCAPSITTASADKNVNIFIFNTTVQHVAALVHTSSILGKHLARGLLRLHHHNRRGYIWALPLTRKK